VIPVWLASEELIRLFLSDFDHHVCGISSPVCEWAVVVLTELVKPAIRPTQTTSTSVTVPVRSRLTGRPVSSELCMQVGL